MDELEISGKRYISAKRAGKENKYHPDYIGQLIRAGKVEGQKVGRSWYVDAESLSTYLNQEPAAATSPEPVEPVQTQSPEALKTNEDAVEEVIEEKELPASEVSVIEEATETEEEPAEAEETPVLIHTQKEPQKIAPPVTSVFPVIPRKTTGGLTYIADEGPFFPQTRVTREDIPDDTLSASAVPQKQSNMLERPKAGNKKRRGVGHIVRGAMTLTLAGALSFGVALGISYVTSSLSTVVGKQVSASVIFSSPFR